MSRINFNRSVIVKVRRASFLDFGKTRIRRPPHIHCESAVKAGFCNMWCVSENLLSLYSIFRGLARCPQARDDKLQATWKPSFPDAKLPDGQKIVQFNFPTMYHDRPRSTEGPFLSHESGGAGHIARNHRARIARL